jgi:hypothetical protein
MQIQFNWVGDDDDDDDEDTTTPKASTTSCDAIAKLHTKVQSHTVLELRGDVMTVIGSKLRVNNELFGPTWRRDTLRAHMPHLGIRQPGPGKGEPNADVSHGRFAARLERLTRLESDVFMYVCTVTSMPLRYRLSYLQYRTRLGKEVWRESVEQGRPCEITVRPSVTHAEGSSRDPQAGHEAFADSPGGLNQVPDFFMYSYRWWRVSFELE